MSKKKKKKVGKKVELRMELRTTVVVVNTVYDEKDNVGARGSGPLNQCALYSYLLCKSLLSVTYPNPVILLNSWNYWILCPNAFMF